MSLTKTLEKNVVYSDGMVLGTITVGSVTLQTRVRCYPQHGNILTLQTLFDTGLSDRSKWADHPQEFGTANGLTATEVQYIANQAKFDTIGWYADERHNGTTNLKGEVRLITKEMADTVDTSISFRITDNGTVEIVKKDDDAAAQLAKLKTQAEADAKLKQTQAETADEALASFKKKALYVAIGVGVLVLGAIGWVVLKNNSESEEKEDDKKKK
jgi:hypothetical protein